MEAAEKLTHIYRLNHRPTIMMCVVGYHFVNQVEAVEKVPDGVAGVAATGKWLSDVTVE